MIDIRKRVFKDVDENVVNPCTTGMLFGGDVNVRTLDRHDKEGRGWVGRTSLVSVAVNGLITERVNLLLRLNVA